MARRAFVFDPPDRFIAAAIGEPGNRTFFLQAREGSRVVSVILEKTLVAVLADRLGHLLQELDERGISKEETRPVPDDSLPDEPMNEAFRAASIALGWDGEREAILIEAREQIEDDDDPTEFEAIESIDDDPEGPDVFRVQISAETARAFVDRAMRVVMAGRSPCPLCGNPLDAQGHICPRKNGQYVN